MEPRPQRKTKADRYKKAVRIAAEHVVDRNPHWAALAYMGCEPGLAPGSMGMYLGVGAGIVRKAPEEGVGLVGLEAAAENIHSEVGFAEACFGTLDMDCDFGSSGLVDCADLPMGCRCDWRPCLRCLCPLKMVLGQSWNALGAFRDGALKTGNLEAELRSNG